MLTIPFPRRTLAVLAGAVPLIACSFDSTERCEYEFCAGLDWEVNFMDSVGRKIDSQGSSGVIITFEPVLTTAEASASTSADCASCGSFLVPDSAMLIADKPITSPGGDIVPAGSNLLEQPWKDMLGSGDIAFRFRQDVQFESGQYAFSMRTLCVFKGTRVVLSDTSYLLAP